MKRILLIISLVLFLSQEIICEEPLQNISDDELVEKIKSDEYLIVLFSKYINRYFHPHRIKYFINFSKKKL